jgi:hypothetical protein
VVLSKKILDGIKVMSIMWNYSLAIVIFDKISD